MNSYIENNFKYFFFITLTVMLLGSQVQTTEAQDSDVSLNVGMNIVSTYVWRGTYYAGPSIQPSIELDAGGFALGVWGDQGFTDANYQEMDPYVGYTFDFGLSLGVTDYYYPSADSTRFFDDPQDDAHAFEANASYTINNFTLAGNYIFAGGGSVGDDVYFQIDYAVSDHASIFVGGGDGWHLENPGEDDFNIVNVGISGSKGIKITDSFSLPVFGSFIVNPDQEQIYVTGGFSL